MSAQPLKTGLIGLGNMGQNHLRVLSMLKNVDLCFVHDTSTHRAGELAALYGCRVSSDLDADLEMVDAVVLATPTSTHYEYIRRVSDHVAAIFVEKPLTDTLESSAGITDLAQRKGLRIQVGFIERFNPAVLALKMVLAGTERIINIDFSRTNKVSSRITDVDVVTDLMIHDIDLALYLNGPARQVSAYGVMEEGMIAFARATIAHENGSFSNITASRITEKRIRKISVTAGDKYIDCNLLRKEVLINKQTLEQYYEKVSITSQEETIDVRPEEALLRELMAFIRYAGCGDPAGIPTDLDGYNAMRIAQNVQEIIRGQQS
jgi:predicted dehydrogenase